MAQLALLFHMNSDHWFYDRNRYLETLRGTRADMFSLENILTSFAVPISVSSTAKDWLIYSLENRQSLQSVLDEGKITILNCPFGHSLPQEYPDFVHRQLELGNAVMQHLFPGLVSAMGFIPEFDVREQDLPLLSTYWKGTVISHTEVSDPQIDVDSDSPFFMLKGRLGDPLPCVLSNSKLLRKEFLRMYRVEKEDDDEHSPAEAARIFRDYLANSPHEVVVFRADLEIPLLNRVYKVGGGVLLPHRLSTYYQFGEAISHLFPRSDITSLDSNFAQRIRKADARTIVPLGINDYDWYFSKDVPSVMEIIKQVQDQAYKVIFSGDYFEAVALIAMTLDTPGARLKLEQNHFEEMSAKPFAGKKGVVVYKPAKDRLYEHNIFMDCLTRRIPIRRLNLSGYPSAVVEYVTLVDKAAQYVDKTFGGK